jgi:hypothetical protein
VRETLDADGRSAAMVRSEIADIVQKNYGRALRKCLSRQELLNVIQEGSRRVWPDLNHNPVKLVSRNEFVRRWSNTGVDFRFTLMASSTGLSLLGFYMKKPTEMRDRPLIYVNTAHHPAVVGVALAHEMGHHLTSEIFGSKRKMRHFLSRAGYGSHLGNQLELAADVLVSLGVYPRNAAQTLFEDSDGKRTEGLVSDPSLLNVLQYVSEHYGLSFLSDDAAGKNFYLERKRKLHAFAAVIHYTKLRRALFEEYGV